MPGVTLRLCFSHLRGVVPGCQDSGTDYDLVYDLNLIYYRSSNTYFFHSLILDPLSRTIFLRVPGNTIMGYVEAFIATEGPFGSLDIGYPSHETSSAHSHQLPRSWLRSPQDDSSYV